LPDERSRFHRLERIDADVRRDDGFVAYRAVVADDDAVLETRGAADIGVASDDTAAQVCRRTDIRVVVHDRPLQVRGFLNGDVRAEHAVLAYVRALLDAAVLADHDRSVDPGAGIDLGSLAEPDALTECEARDLDIDAP